MIITGVNHKATNRAIYSSLAIIGLERLLSIGSVHDANFTGSAEHYLGQDDEVAQYLYAYMIARNCSGKKFCYEPASTGAVSISLTDLIILVERMYVDPLSHIGGDYSEIINPQIIHYAPLNTKVMWGQVTAISSLMMMVFKIYGW